MQRRAIILGYLCLLLAFPAHADTLPLPPRKGGEPKFFALNPAKYLRTLPVKPVPAPTHPTRMAAAPIARPAPVSLAAAELRPAQSAAQNTPMTDTQARQLLSIFAEAR